jgi:hypothetical protein
VKNLDLDKVYELPADTRMLNISRDMDGFCAVELLEVQVPGMLDKESVGGARVRWGGKDDWWVQEMSWDRRANALVDGSLDSFVNTRLILKRIDRNDGMAEERKRALSVDPILDPNATIELPMTLVTIGNTSSAAATFSMPEPGQRKIMID